MLVVTVSYSWPSWFSIPPPILPLRSNLAARIGLIWNPPALSILREMSGIWFFLYYKNGLRHTVANHFLQLLYNFHTKHAVTAYRLTSFCSAARGLVGLFWSGGCSIDGQ